MYYHHYCLDYYYITTIILHYYYYHYYYIHASDDVCPQDATALRANSLTGTRTKQTQTRQYIMTHNNRKYTETITSNNNINY